MVGGIMKLCTWYFRFFVLLALTLSFAQNALAQEATEIRPFGIVQIEKLGREILEQDSYAARATDELRRAYPALGPQDISGWIVERRNGGAVVRFFRAGPDGAAAAAFDVDFQTPTANPTVSRADGAAVSDVERAKFAARQLALSGVTEPCSPAYNTVVLEDPERDGWLVYALSASTEPGMIIGGHYRFSVSRDGTRIVQADRLSLSCIVIRPDTASIPEGATVVGAYITHVVSDTPVETHVFATLLNRMPLHVGTVSGVWYIDGGKVELVKKAGPGR